MISVVMPSYNSAAFVAEAIESVLAQTFPYFELLVCDDGSTDGTQAIVQEYTRRDGRVRLLQHGFRSVSRNCNAAMEAARYDWIARIDADDIMHRHRLERQMAAAAADPSVVLWGGFARLIDRTGRILRTAALGPTSEAGFQELRHSGRMIVILGPTVMFRRSLALELGGYDPRFDPLRIWSCWTGWRTMDQVGRSRMLSRYRIHGTSVTATSAVRQAACYAISTRAIGPGRGSSGPHIGKPTSKLWTGRHPWRAWWSGQMAEPVYTTATHRCTMRNGGLAVPSSRSAWPSPSIPPSPWAGSTIVLSAHLCAACTRQQELPRRLLRFRKTPASDVFRFP